MVWTKEDDKLYSKKYREIHKEELSQRAKKYYSANREKIKQQVKNRYEKNKEYMRKRANEYNRKKRREMREICINHYGGRCECCGENIYEFLTIDHINGGGNQHVKEIKKEMNTNSIYAWLIKHNFPEGFRVLCYNCNCCLGHYGYCAHKK